MNPVLQKKSLLIVEDEDDLRSALVDTLIAMGVEVVSAPNGKVALEVLNDTSVDAILCDLNMPQMGGLDFLRALRDEGIGIPFVILTGVVDDQNLVSALRLNAVDYLVKPADPSELVAAVKKAIDLGRLSKKVDFKIRSAVSHEKEKLLDEIEKENKNLVKIRARR